MVVAISNDRTVPVQEDLTTEEQRLSVLRGLENMNRVDYPIADGVELGLGEWGVLNADGKLERPTATPKPNTYLVFAGTDRFDVKATGKVTIVQNSDIVAKTSRYDTGATYAVGDGLTVKDLGSGEAFLTKATGTEPVLARFLKLEGGCLFFESRAA